MCRGPDWWWCVTYSIRWCEKFLDALQASTSKFWGQLLSPIARSQSLQKPLVLSVSQNIQHNMYKEKDACTHCILLFVHNCSAWFAQHLPYMPRHNWIWHKGLVHDSLTLCSVLTCSPWNKDGPWNAMVGRLAFGGQLRTQGSDSIRRASKDLTQKVKGDVLEEIAETGLFWTGFFHPGDVLRFWLSSFSSFLNPPKTRPLRTIEEGPRSKGNVWTLVVLLTGHLWPFGAIITPKFSYLTGRCTTILWAKKGLCTGIPGPKQL